MVGKKLKKADQAVVAPTNPKPPIHRSRWRGAPFKTLVSWDANRRRKSVVTRSRPKATHRMVNTANRPPKRFKVVRQSSPNALRMKGAAANPPPTTSPNMALAIPLTRTTSRWGNHCCIRKALAGCRAIMVIPKANRPRSKTANTGAQPCMKRNPVPNRRVTVVSILGL